MIQRRIFLGLSASALVFLGSGFGLADQTPDAATVVKKSLEALYYPGNDMVTQVTMSLISSDGKARTRKLSLLRKNVGTGGEQRYFIYFHAPADIVDMSFLVHKFPDRDDDRWLFIPAVRMVKRIAANDKRSSFVGSDFTYEDVSGRDIQDEKGTLVRSENLGGRPCFVIEGVPKEKSSYARRLSWIDKEHFLPLKEEFMNDKGDKVRSFSADEVTRISGVWTIVKRTMIDSRSGHRTEVVFRDIRYGVGLDDNIFTETALRSPPRQWLK